MLSVHIKEADRRRLDLHPQLTAGAKKLQQAANDFSDAVLTSVNEDVTAVYLAERQIETELRNVERLMSTHAALSAQWGTTLSRVTNELKEMGDLSHWIGSIGSLAEEIREVAKKIEQK